MAELIDINNEKFWDVLFDEACVEGQQAERIQKDLEKIATSEAEIRARAVDEFVEKLHDAIKNKSIKHFVYHQDFNIITVETVTELIDEIASQMKESE